MAATQVNDQPTTHQQLPVMPVLGNVLFPGTFLPLVVDDEKMIAAAEEALERPDRNLIALTLQSTSRAGYPLGNYELSRVGTQAVISRLQREHGKINIVLNGIQRVMVEKLSDHGRYLEAQVRVLEFLREDDPEATALLKETLKLVEEMNLYVVSETGQPIADLVHRIANPVTQIYLIAILLNLDMDKQQALLEASSKRELCRLAHAYVSYEYKVQKLREKIAGEVSNELGKEEREYLLRRQLSEIRKELGDEVNAREELRDLTEKLEAKSFPENVRIEVDKEIKRLAHMTDTASEYQIIRSHLELIADLPWTESTPDNFDLGRAQMVLDEDHYGLKDIKDRILEQLAVLKLNPQARAPILCFVGPPGVGKTSLGQSIARALERKFERMSLGGMHDEAELRGHRRTYVGAMPGRIIEAMRRAGSKNPLLMLDEVDKLRTDFAGDPAAALMEVLDPAQNCAFHDNYLDLPFDLSHVFFIATANSTDSIPRPLLDRMEILRLSGYTDEEKIQIAKRYLLPRRIKESGLEETQLRIPDGTLQEIIRQYTREAGVRELERRLAHVARKVAMRVAQGETEEVTLEPDSLHKYLGPRLIFVEQVREKWSPGVATGLAWTETGGDLIYIEACLLPQRKADLKMTGHLGEVMRESVQTAISYVWSRPELLESDKARYRHAGLHIHIPAGATPKDGPSAGLAIAIALASLYTHHPVRKDLAVTGEITLSGLVLPVGGIKDKILAAHRAGIHEVMLPKANERDLDQLPESTRHALQFFLVDDMEEALREAIPPLHRHLSSRTAFPSAEAGDSFPRPHAPMQQPPPAGLPL
ncbi:endopeptidase La [Oligoflexus tunisiensis]|uniref:endopeptidase La n=1 Tax=Oligoflexus tunisiensis TaxID=708132 RepID=UPI000AF18E18|nr:endopeptidase La [Oligoflexus tunisiensis]